MSYKIDLPPVSFVTSSVHSPYLQPQPYSQQPQNFQAFPQPYSNLQPQPYQQHSSNHCNMTQPYQAPFQTPVMGSYGMPAPFHSPPPPPAHKDLELEDVEVNVVQHPKEALVAQLGKEKSRKPIDPPPVIELKAKYDADPHQHFLHSPYLFATATLWSEDGQEKFESHCGTTAPVLAGNTTSSLYKLKHIDGHEGGFFIFGDMSVRITGKFCLKFTIYDLRASSGSCVWLGEVMSDPFIVCAHKDFRGMEESTKLSKAFADQGVRLRLRKEPRGYSGKARQFPVQSPRRSPTEQAEQTDSSHGEHRPSVASSFDAQDDHYSPDLSSTEAYRMLPYPEGMFYTGKPFYDQELTN